MALGGVLCDAIGFSAEFVLFALLTACAAPYALFCAFGNLPAISGTAAAKAKAEEAAAAKAAAAEKAKAAKPKKLSAKEKVSPRADTKHGRY